LKKRQLRQRKEDSSSDMLEKGVESLGKFSLPDQPLILAAMSPRPA